MSEIRIISPGKTRGYPYTVCKKYCDTSLEPFQTVLMRDHNFFAEI